MAHDVINVGPDRGQLSAMAKQAPAAMDVGDLEVAADRGCFKGKEFWACEEAGVRTFFSKPLTSGSKAESILLKD